MDTEGLQGIFVRMFCTSRHFRESIVIKVDSIVQSGEN